MDVRELLETARDTLTVKRVFGEPYEVGGATVVPVARVVGGGGGGQQDAGEAGGADDVAGGSGGGFGMSARPAGMYVIRGDKVRWEPALDINRIVLGAQAVAVVALVVGRSVLKARLKS